MAMSDLLLRVAIIEKNDRGQEVELVRKTMQFKPQVSLVSCTSLSLILFLIEPRVLICMFFKL